MSQTSKFALAVGSNGKTLEQVTLLVAGIVGRPGCASCGRAAFMISRAANKSAQSGLAR